jgi:hypothetical protein
VDLNRGHVEKEGIERKVYENLINEWLEEKENCYLRGDNKEKRRGDQQRGQEKDQDKVEVVQTVMHMAQVYMKV